MHRLVTGSFPDFAGAARGVSALMAAGFTHGEISIIAIPPPEAAPIAPPVPAGNVRAGASLLGALGAMVGPGTVSAWALPDPGAILLFAPSAGALAGACLGAIVGVLLDRLARSAPRPALPRASPERIDAESVTVVVDESRVGAVESILRQHGARVPQYRERRHALAPATQPLLLVPYRP